jgi:hypothetical protein
MQAFLFAPDGILSQFCVRDTEKPTVTVVLVKNVADGVRLKSGCVSGTGSSHRDLFVASQGT